MKYTKHYFLERDILITHLAQAIELLMKKNKLKSVLDIGCGTGRLVAYFQEKGFASYGCDNAAEAITIARKNARKNSIKKTSAISLPYKDNSFDLVSAISVIEHLSLKDGGKMIAEIRRVLKPNGFVFLVTPNFASPFRLLQGKKWFGYSDPTHISFYTTGSLKKMLELNGFKNFQTRFEIKFSKSLQWEFIFFKFLPRSLLMVAIHLLFNSPLSKIRNSFWLAARKE